MRWLFDVIHLYLNTIHSYCDSLQKSTYPFQMSRVTILLLVYRFKVSSFNFGVYLPTIPEILRRLFPKKVSRCKSRTMYLKCTNYGSLYCWYVGDLLNRSPSTTTLLLKMNPPTIQIHDFERSLHVISTSSESPYANPYFQVTPKDDVSYDHRGAEDSLLVSCTSFS